jgi:hypothetical protein
MQVCSLVKGQNSVNDYLNFLSKEHLSPKDYIFKQFETSDIVILGERDHRDTSQYDLILDILSDERFISNIGHVYTEVGVINRTEWANTVLKDQYSNDSEFEKELISLYRELDFNPIWDKYNMFKYLKGVYNINKTLPVEKKITVGLTDCEFDWKGMTFQKYNAFEKKIYKEAVTRDSIMASNFLTLYERQKPINGKKKALLIQNQPHAVNINVIYRNKRIRSTASYIKDSYGSNVKTILLNWYDYKEAGLTDDGKWDAAFELSNLQPVGFDLSGTPFGHTIYHLNYEQNITYQDVADGFLFYKPFYQFVAAIGVPNLVDDDFANELLSRSIIVSGEGSKRANKYLKSPVSAKEGLSRYNHIRTFDCGNNRQLKRQMKKWM